MSKSLTDLHPEFRSLAQQLLDACSSAGIDVVVVDTLRTASEQEVNLANGTSKRKDSLHLYGLAIDIAPRECLPLKNWAPKHPLWDRLGPIGEALGLVWGGRWKRPVDKPHFQCPAEMERRLLPQIRAARKAARAAASSTSAGN